LESRSAVLLCVFSALVWVTPGRAAAQACTAPIEGDIGCLGTASGRVEYADGDDVMGSCGGGISLGAPDNVFTFTCSGAGTVDLSLTGMDCDIDLFVLGPGDCTTMGGCHAQSTNGLTPLSSGAMIIDEALTFTCTPNETYYVVVDAFGQSGQTDCDACGFFCRIGGCANAYPPMSNVGVVNCDDAMMEGSYTLMVTSGGSLGCGEHCSDLVDNDGDGDVDCDDSDCSGMASCASCAGCDIGGSCVSDGTVNPANPCEVCDVSASTTAWSPAPDGRPCPDSTVCDGREVCSAGSCVDGPALDCDDGDDCTTDTCMEPGGCAHASVAGCCNVALDCDDGDVCTTDDCTGSGGTCTAAPISGCCVDDADCSDASACTDDSCDTSTNRCVFTPVAGCCADAADCDDGNDCTTDSCDATSGACANDPIADCCLGDGDCDDGDVCTADACASSSCVNVPIDGCCMGDDVCDDGMECTTDTCDVRTFRCISDVTAVCCAGDGDCDDGDDCTIDFCDEFGVCDSNPDPACCDVDCNDDDSCTRDSCESDRVTCVNEPIAGCCADDSDCRAPDVCTAGRCAAPAADAGVPDGSAPDGGTPPSAMEDGGCGCETPGRPSRGHTWLVLVLLAIWVSRSVRLRLRRG
jgi:hypothetical protein